MRNKNNKYQKNTTNYTSMNYSWYIYIHILKNIFIFFTCLVSLTTICTPICIFCFCKLKSSKATFTFSSLVGIACDALAQFNANPSTNSVSIELKPWLFRMWILLMGHFTLPSFSDLTRRAAVTANSEKKSDSEPMILLDILVLAEKLTRKIIIIGSLYEETRIN